MVRSTRSCFNSFRYGYGEFLQLFNFGYQTEHLRVAIQFSVAGGLAALMMDINAVRGFFSNSPLWTFIIISIIMEPLVGKTIKKGVATCAGLILGAGIGSGVAALWETVCYDCLHQRGFGPCGKGMTSAAVIVGGFGLMLNQMRFPEYADSFKAALIMYFACIYLPELRPLPAGLISPHLDGTNASYFIFKAKILLSAICGVVVICLTSLFIFPNTAGRRVKRQSERILERLGNITFRALGEFCQEPNPDMRIPGTTGSDKHLRFVDDGLEIKYAGLMQQLQDVGDEIYQATELLPSAQAEIAFSERWWRSPRFPVQTYAFVFRCATNILTTLLAIVTTLHDGSVRLGLCVRHHDLMDDVRQDITTAFTALAGIIHKSVSEEYVAEKFRAMADALVELYHGVNAAPQNVYDNDMETFAIFTKSAINLARQTALIFRELSPVKGKGMHAYIAASFAQTIDNQQGVPLSHQGSLAILEKTMGKSSGMGDLFKHPKDHHLTNMMLDRVKSFHADDNPFESMSEENAEPFMFRTWSVASQSSYSRQGSAPLPAIPDAHARHSSAPIPGLNADGHYAKATDPSAQSATGYGRGRDRSSRLSYDSRLRTKHGSLERVSEEEPLQRTSSQDERLERMAQHRRGSRDFDLLANDEGWDEVMIRRHLLGKLLTRAGTDDIAVRREQLRAAQAAEAVDPPPVPLSSLGKRSQPLPIGSSPKDPPGRRRVARVPSKRTSRDSLLHTQDWRTSSESARDVSTASSKRRITLLDSLDVPWDANFVHRRLELGAMSNHSSLADPYVGGSPFSSPNHSGVLPNCAASPKPSVHSTKSPTDTTGNEVDSPLEPPLEIVEEEPEEAAPVDPRRRLKKARTFSEYTRLWRASEDGPQPATAEELPRPPPIRTLVAPPPLAPPPEARAPIANGHHPLEAAGANPGASDTSHLDMSTMHAAQAIARSREASAEQAEDAEVADSWRKLREVSFDRLLVPVSPVTYDDLSEREASQRLLSMGPADSVSTTRSNSTGNGSVYSSGSVRKFRGTVQQRGMDRDRRFRTAAGGSLTHDRSRSFASNSNSWKDDNLDAHLNGLQPEAPVPPQVAKKSSTDQLREMVMQEGRARNPGVWESDSSDANLRAWLRAPHALALEKRKPAPPALRQLRPAASDLGNGRSTQEPPPPDPRIIQTSYWERPQDSNLLGEAVPAPKAPKPAFTTGIINKELWNLDVDVEQPHAPRQPIVLDEPNLDFVAVKINDWDDSSRRGRNETNFYGRGTQRGFDNGVDRAKQSVIGAAKSFWEARLKFRN